MKTNLFKIKEKKEKKIVIEEERLKNPFLLFLKRNKNFILISGIMLIICLLLVSTGLAFSLFRGSNDYDISYIEGSEIIGGNKDPDIDDEDIKDELLGEVAREEGIVLLVKTSMSSQGDVISHFTDGTTIIVKANGKIYRVSTDKNENYGVNKDGKISNTAKKILVTSTTTTLSDGTIITYYSDGSAKIEHNNQTLFIRDSNNIKIDSGNTLNTLLPSGVAPTKETIKTDRFRLKKFTSKNSLIIFNGKKFILNRNTEATVEENELKYSGTNAFAAIDEQTLKDGNVVTHFSNGSAIITEPNGNITYVKKSGDILLKNKKLYEILPNPAGYSNSRTTLNIADGKKVTYFDDASAIIINKDGTRQYVQDNEDIIYDEHRNINSNPTVSKMISEGTIETGEKAYSFENGKTQVIRNNNTSYIIDTEKLTFKKEEKPEEEKPEEEKPSHQEPDPNPGEGIYISEAENVYNDFRNIEKTTFIIKNNTKETKHLRITIEEVENYAKYNTDRLPPEHVKFQGNIDGIPIPETPLTKNTWSDEEERRQYVIYEGPIYANKPLDVTLILLVDYEKLYDVPYNDASKNYGFIGTIRVYVDDGREE